MCAGKKMNSADRNAFAEAMNLFPKIFVCKFFFLIYKILNKFFFQNFKGLLCHQTTKTTCFGAMLNVF